MDRMLYIIVCDSLLKKIYVIDEDGCFFLYVFIDLKFMLELFCLSYVFCNDFFLVGLYNGNKIGVFRYVIEKNEVRIGKYYYMIQII